MKKEEKEFISRIYPWGLALALMIMSYGIYSNAIDNDYNLDDELVTNNHALQNTDFSKMKSLDFGQLTELFKEPYYKDAAGNKYEYRPVVMASFYLEFWLTGKKPAASTQKESLEYAATSHRINVWIYVFTCMLIFYLLLLLFQTVQQRYILAFVTTLLFVVHPLHTEAVASIKSRDELLSMFFGVSAWICALMSVDRKAVPARAFSYVLYLLFFLAAIFSKQTTITFSILIPASVVLFRKVNFWYYLVLVFPVVAISSAFAPIYLLYVKVALSIGTMLFLIAFYLFVSKRDETISYIKKARTGTRTYFTQKVNYKTVSIVAGVFAVLFISVYLIGKLNDNAAKGLKKAEYAISDPLRDFNELQVTPFLQQPAPSVIPIAGRKLAFVETPLTYVDNKSEKIGTSLYALGYYLKLMFFPNPLSFYYGYNQIPITGFGNAFVLISLLAYTAILIGIFYLLYKRKHPIAAFGLLFFLVAMLPLSNLITPIAGIVAERLSFSASLGFCIAFCYLLFYPFMNKNTGWVKQIGQPGIYGGIAIFGLIVVVFMYRTHQRNYDWKNHMTLFEADMPHLQKSARAHHLYASHLAYSTIKERTPDNKPTPDALRKLNIAVPEFQKSLEIYPEFPFAWFDLAKTYVLMGDMQKAIPAYIRSTEIDSQFSPPFFELGVVLTESGRYNEAEKAYLSAIKKDTTFVQAYTNLSYLYFMMQRYDQSVAVNKLALKRIPNSYEPLVNLGKTYMTLRDTSNALIYLEQAIAVNHLDKTLVNGVADVYRAKRDSAKEQYYRNLMR